MFTDDKLLYNRYYLAGKEGHVTKERSVSQMVEQALASRVHNVLIAQQRGVGQSAAAQHDYQVRNGCYINDILMLY